MSSLDIAGGRRHDAVIRHPARRLASMLVSGRDRVKRGTRIGWNPTLACSIVLLEFDRLARRVASDYSLLLAAARDRHALRCRSMQHLVVSARWVVRRRKPDLHTGRRGDPVQAGH